MPTFDLSTLPFFATVILLFPGMEMAGFHALETRKPGPDYPKAMALSAVIIFFCTVMATLSIAFVIPADQPDLAAGVMQAIEYFFTALGIPGAIAPMAVLITIGGVVSLAAWLIGPALGLGVVAQEGNMPPCSTVPTNTQFTGGSTFYPGTDWDIHLPPVCIPAVS